MNLNILYKLEVFSGDNPNSLLKVVYSKHSQVLQLEEDYSVVQQLLLL